MLPTYLRNARRPLRFWPFWAAIGLGLVGAVIYLSLTPQPPELPGPLGWDKLDHAVTYAILMGWFAQLYETPRARALLAVAFILLGVVLELLQYVVGYRTLDLVDVAANTLGVLSVWPLAQTRFALGLRFLERRFLPAA